jgi:hypothetical protein
MIMADNGVNHGDITAHAATYGGVINMLKWGTLACILIAALVIWLIAS